MINRLAIIGVGLIGGSLARALRKAQYVDEIVGFGRSVESLQQAVELGVIDRAAASISEAVEQADMIVVAVPVGRMPEVFAQLADRVPRSAVLTDVGSVKEAVITAARARLRDDFPVFVPGHPIAGTEHSGVGASTGDLFQDHRVILTPVVETDPVAVARVEAMWEAAGAIVVSMTAAEHDKVLADCSHLPHLLAYCLVDMLVRQDDHRTVFEFAAGGFRDFTRIASSDPVMWRDVCLANRDAVLNALRQYRDELGEMLAAIENGDGQWLLETFRRAKHARDSHIV